MNARDVYRCGRLLNRLRWATHLRLLCGHEWQPSPFVFFDAIEELLVSIAETSKLSVQADRLRLLRTELHDMLTSLGNDEARADWWSELVARNPEEAAAIERRLFFSAAEGLVERVERVIEDAVSEHQMPRCESLLQLSRTLDQLVRPRRLFGELALTQSPECSPSPISWLAATATHERTVDRFFWDSTHANWFCEIRRRVRDCGLAITDDWWNHFLNQCRSSRSVCRRELLRFGRSLRERFEFCRPRIPVLSTPSSNEQHARGRKVKPDDVRKNLQMVHELRTKIHPSMKRLAAAYHFKTGTARKRIERYAKWYDEANGDVDIAARLCCREFAQSGRLARAPGDAAASRA